MSAQGKKKQNKIPSTGNRLLPPSLYMATTYRKTPMCCLLFLFLFLSQRVPLCQPKMTSKSWWSSFCPPRSGKMECVSTPRDKTSLYQVFAWFVASNKAKTLWEGTRTTRSSKWPENSSVAARITNSTQSLDAWPTYMWPTMNCFTVHPWS